MPVGFSRNLVRNRAGPRHVGAPSNRHSFNFFGLEQGCRNFLGARTQIPDNFGEILSCMESLSLPAQYFPLFQWCLTAPKRLAPRARLDHPLYRAWYGNSLQKCVNQKQQWKLTLL